MVKKPRNLLLFIIVYHFICIFQLISVFIYKYYRKTHNLDMPGEG